MPCDALNSDAVKQWQLAGPERSRLLEEFGSEYLEDSGVDYSHHEQSSAMQCNFHKHANDLYEEMKRQGNHFLETCPELVTLGTRDCATNSAI